MKVIWNENTCTHAGECVKGLPQVFKIEDEKFVIDESGASEEAIRRQVALCPSGALTVEE
jgi:uncharacterized Fe-S cluster protein YjdI